MKKSVVIIDSGIGGLSLLPNFLKKLPIKKYVYFADIKNLPYGEKTTEDLFNIAVSNIRFVLKKFNPLFIVIGCNTIGMCIYNDLCKFFSNVKIFSVKPNLEICSYNKMNLVLATSRTIDCLQKTLKKDKQTILLKMPKLASLVEKNLNNFKNIYPYLKNKLEKYKNFKNIILGCTHYYFVKEEISKIIPDAKIVDGVEILSNEINKYLLKNNFRDKNKKVKVKLYFTNKCENKKVYKELIRYIIVNL